MKHFEILICMLILATGQFACQEDKIEPDVFGSLFGQVLLESNNSVLSDVQISTSPPTSTFLTDATGNFAIENIKTGTYIIRAEKAGFVTAIENVTIFENQNANVVIQMKEEDETNKPPTPPLYLAPANGANGLGIELTLAWEASDEDDDPLEFDVFLFNPNQSPGTTAAEALTADSLVVSDLKYGSTYFWQVVVSDGKADPVYGEVWSFETQPFPNHPFIFAKVNNGKYDIFGAQSASASVPLYQLTEMPGSNFRPRISPVGNKVAFLSNNFPNTQIYVMNRDGSNPTLVPAPVAVDGNDKFQLDFCWSPDGTQLMFMNENFLYRINVDGSGFELFAELPPGQEFAEVDWSGISDKIAVRTVGSQPYISRILLYESDGTFIQEVVPDLPGNIGGPAFSILGNSILYTHDLDGLETPDGRQLNSHVFLKNLDTGEVKDLSVDKAPGTNDLDPRFSPNGALVIFVNTQNTPNAAKNIYLMNLDGEARTALFQNAEMPDWR